MRVHLLLSLIPACCLVLCPHMASAASYSTSAPPRTGLESPDTPLKGRKIPTIEAFGDAYGNPITPDVREKPRKERLRNGAYGGKRQRERPLPDPMDERPLW